MSRPKKQAFCTMDAFWSICCTNHSEKRLGVNRSGQGCICGSYPGEYNVYKLTPIKKKKATKK